MVDTLTTPISLTEPTSLITPVNALKASKFTQSIQDVTDNDSESPVLAIVLKFGYPTTQIELDGLKLIADQIRREKRLSVIKFIFGALIASIPAILLFLMGKV